MKKTLILGIGNEILGDDAVGIKVVDKCKSMLNRRAVDFLTLNTLGLDLLNIIQNYEKIIVVDGVITKKLRVGEVAKINLNSNCSAIKYSIHDIGIKDVLEIAKKLNLKIPEIIIYGIRIKKPKLGNDMCELVKNAIPKTVHLIVKDLK